MNKARTVEKLTEVFGFDVVVISSSNFTAHNETRTRYTVKRPNGKKFYHAIAYPCGTMVATG